MFWFVKNVDANCQGCCSHHGGVVCVNGVTQCADGRPLSSKCRSKGCSYCFDYYDEGTEDDEGTVNDDIDPYRRLRDNTTTISTTNRTPNSELVPATGGFNTKETVSVDDSLQKNKSTQSPNAGPPDLNRSTTSVLSSSKTVTGKDERSLLPRPRKKMMVAGWGIFGGMYLLSAILGSTMLDSNDPNQNEECENCRDVGMRLFIPIVGPFWATPRAEGTDEKALTTFLGVSQVAGLTIALIGTIRYAIKKRQYLNSLHTRESNPALSLITFEPRRTSY